MSTADFSAVVIILWLNRLAVAIFAEVLYKKLKAQRNDIR